MSYEVLKNSTTLTDYQRKDLTVQKMLMDGKAPFEIYTSDSSLLSAIYGKFYAGGYIFSLNDDYGTILPGGLVLTILPNQYAKSPSSSCATPEFSSPRQTRSKENRIYEDSIEGDFELTETLANFCPNEINSATICRDLKKDSFEDWFLPTVYTVMKMNRNYLSNQNILDLSRVVVHWVENSTRTFPYRNDGWDINFSLDLDYYNFSDDGGSLYPVRAF